jgi:hypothetical protein
VLHQSYDVIVCGGGIAGIAAALAAARNGARTCLVEREYALGGLATLGLIVVYVPLCDGSGVQMSGGLAEELLRLSLKYGPGEIAPAWLDPAADRAARSRARYMVQYNAASLMIAAEEQLLADGVTLLYSAHVSAVTAADSRLASVRIETKTGPLDLTAAAFVDATGDADICYFAGEPTVDDDNNRRTGWYYSYDGQDLQLHPLTDPLYGEVPPTSRYYSGTDIESISQNCIDGRRMILEHVLARRAHNPAAYPLLIPTFHGLRMTRRLEGPFHFSEDQHEGVWFDDAVGMIGSWKTRDRRYAIPYRSICAVRHDNLYAAGRCCCADKSGWDLTRVIPTCAVTGEAAGTAAALQARTGLRPDAGPLQNSLTAQGVLLDDTLFQRKEQA